MATEPRIRRSTWRGFTSVLALMSFVVVLVSGVVLFFVPPGRVANWSNIQLLGLSKTQWQLLHTSFSLLFVLAAILHLAFNWRPMVTYFKSRPPRRFSFGWQWIIPLLICAAVFIAAAQDRWPLSKLTEWRQEIKQSYNEPSSRPAHATNEARQGKQRRLRGGRNG